MRDSQRCFDSNIKVINKPLKQPVPCHASELAGAPQSKSNSNLLKEAVLSIPAASVLAMLLLATRVTTFAQTVPGIAFDPPASSSPAPAQPGELQGTISAPQLTVGEKFEYRIVQSFGLRNFVGAAIGAAIGQRLNSPHEWGQGVGGYAERYASSFAGTFSRETFAFTLEAALREDPRYFPLAPGASYRDRALNALKQVAWSKRDDGSSGFAYARIFSTFGGAEFTNLWQPPSTSGQVNALRRASFGLGADFGYNFLQEFIPFVRPISLRHRH